ncbi:MAG: GNAT family N-acetyltransferase [Bacteroidaceae bacterium]|nr:GNAT family N-acetyltransferase [Bacteroidaceae bacterium]
MHPLRLVSYTSGANLPILPGKNTFHSSELFRLYEATEGYAPLLLVAYRKNKPVAKMLATRISSTYLFGYPLYHRLEIYDTGEYFEEEQREATFQEMLTYLTQELNTTSNVIEFRNLSNGLWGYGSFRKNHYFPIDWLRIRNSVHSPKWQDRISNARKRQIQKGLRKGATIEEAKNLEEILAFYKMLKHNYSAKWMKYFPNISFFMAYYQMEEVKPLFRTFLVKYKGKIIGGSVCVYSDNEMAVLFSSGLSKRYYTVYPGVLAVWGILKQAKEEHISHVEFMNVGLPFRKNPYRNFIFQFGGKQTSTRRWFRFRWKFFNKLAEKIYV